MPRILLWIVAILVVVVLLLGIAAALVLDKEKLVALASDTIRKQTGAELRVEGVTSLTLFPMLGVSLKDAQLQLPDEQPGMVSVRALDVGVRFIPLLKRELEIDGIAVDGLLAELHQRSTPELDTSGFSDAELDEFYRKRRELIAGASPDATTRVLAAPLALKVEQLTVTDATFRLIDADTGDVDTLILNRLVATGLNLDADPVELEARLSLPAGDGEPPVAVTLDGRVRIDQAKQSVVLEPLSIAVEGPTPNSVKLNARGEVLVSAQIADLALQIKSGATVGKGNLRYASFESPQLNADLAFNLLDPAALGLLGAAAADAPGADRPDTAAVEHDDRADEPLPLDAIRGVDGRVKLAIDKAVIGAHDINDLRVLVRAREGVVKLRSLTGELHGGKLQAKATLDGKHRRARLETQGTVTALDMVSALRAAGARPLLTGMADIEWDLESRGTTRTELIEALEGPIEIDVGQAELMDISVEGMLCKVVALINGEQLSAEFPASSRFEQLSARLQLQDGKLRLSPLDIKLPYVSLSGEGRLYLLEENFRAKFAARLSPELARLDPACRVNERLTAIDWPVECKGDIAGDPGDWCAVDSEEILSDLATDELQRKIKKEAGRWLDKIIPD
jgi:uncharacterized protein involved in outer membrane biogenesis